MARPLPKTNAPAFAKNAPSCASRVQSSPVATAHADGPCGLNATSAGAALLPNQRFGGARTSHTNTPAPNNSRTLSHCGTHDSVVHVPEIHGELRSQRTGHELRQRESFLVVLIGDPVTLLHQIAIHVSDQRDRTTEADAAQLQEVERKLGKRVRDTFA